MTADTTTCNVTKTSKNERKLNSILVEFLCLLLLGSKRSKELGLLVVGLESSVSELGGGIDELDVDSLEVLPGGLHHHRLAKDKRTLLNSNGSSLEHDPILVDLSVMGESSHGGDVLLSKISRSTARGGISLLSDEVYLLVNVGTVEVSILTGTGDGGGNTGRMP